MDDIDLLTTLHEAVDAVVAALNVHDDWGLSGARAGQYVSDLVADRAANSVLLHSGLAVLSEESGLLGDPDGVVVVVDPLDGSTNASRGLPWFATSICAVDGDGPLAAVVHDHPNHRRFDAIRGDGARLDGRRLSPRRAVPLSEAIVAVNAIPPAASGTPGWAQYRTYGATSLEMCGVAAGTFDGYIDFGPDGLGAWDYLGAMLVCQECEIEVVDAYGRTLVTTSHSERRNPVAAPSQLLVELLGIVRSGS